MTSAPSGGRKDCTCPRARHAHGSRGAYSLDGCRCFHCRVAHSLVQARWAAGQGCPEPGVWVDPQISKRRIEALHVVGWSAVELGDRLGMTKQAVRSLCLHPAERMLATTAERIGHLYDQLWDVAPVGKAAQRTRAWAKRQGWLPPLALDETDEDFGHDRKIIVADVETRITYQDTNLLAEFLDEIAIERVIHGDRVPLTKPETSEAIRRMKAMGYSAAESAERIGVTERTVVRYRGMAA